MHACRQVCSKEQHGLRENSSSVASSYAWRWTASSGPKSEERWHAEELFVLTYKHTVDLHRCTPSEAQDDCLDSASHMSRWRHVLKTFLMSVLQITLLTKTKTHARMSFCVNSITRVASEIDYLSCLLQIIVFFAKFGPYSCLRVCCMLFGYLSYWMLFWTSAATSHQPSTNHAFFYINKQCSFWSLLNMYDASVLRPFVCDQNCNCRAIVLKGNWMNCVQY